VTIMNEMEISTQKKFQPQIDPNIGETTEISWTPPADLTEEQWTNIGFTLQTVYKSMRWWLGDWLNHGDARYGETYAQAIIVTDSALETLKKYKSVAQRVKAEDRISELSWTHHFYVAYLPREEHGALLRIAHDLDLTSRVFRLVVELPPDEREQLIDLFEQFDSPGEYAHTLAAIRTLEASGSIYLPDEGEEEEEPEESTEPKSTDSVEHEIVLGDDILHYQTDAGENVFNFWENVGVPVVHADLQSTEWKGIRVVAILDEDGDPLLLWDMVGVE